MRLPPHFVRLLPLDCVKLSAGAYKQFGGIAAADVAFLPADRALTKFARRECHVSIFTSNRRECINFQKKERKRKMN